MSIQKNFNNVRLGLKVDTLENWNSSTLVLKRGEIAFATISASAGTGLTEPVVMMKIGDGEKTFSQLGFDFYAKASDVIAACKSTEALTAFVNGLINSSDFANNGAVKAITDRLTTAEGAITKLNGDENTAGSVANSIKTAIDALDLTNELEKKVDKENGKSLLADTEIARLVAMSDGANKVEASETNGNIKVDGAEVTVYTHPEKHAIDDVTGLQDALNSKAAEEHDHTASEITDFATEVAKVKVDEAVKATQDGNGKVISETYAEKATTIAGYGITDAYTKDEVDDEIDGAISTFVSAYITSDGGAIDKLQEIANWIDSDKDGAADIIADVEANADAITGLGERMTAAEEAIEGIDNHSHTNKDVIDDITADKVAAWDASEKNAKDHADNLNTAMNTRVEALEAIDHEHANKAELDLIATGDKAKWDTAAEQANTNKTAIEAINNEETGILAQAKKYADDNDTKYTADADGGLKLSEDNAFSLDESITFIFNCGTSAEIE